jgi:hypothetical protein
MTSFTFATLADPCAPYTEIMARHLAGISRDNRAEALLVADDLAKKGRRPDRDALTVAVDRLLTRHIVDRVVRLSEIDAKALSRKHFGATMSASRDHRSIPLLGWVAAIEAAQTDLVAYFDSDILMHQAPGHDWIAEAADIMYDDPSVMFVAPHPGPPTADGQLYEQEPPPQIDERGNFRWKLFSSRRFLVSKSRFFSMLPTPPQYISWKRAVAMKVGYGNALLPRETTVSRALQASPFDMVYLRSPKAWFLHSPDHGAEWQNALPKLIENVERGLYPIAQAGRCELKLQAWAELVR